jgi:rhodanese-related sulfurtransferase
MPSKSEAVSTATATTDVATLIRWLEDGHELALLDVREHGQYGEGHPFFAVHAAYSMLESEVLRLVPRHTTRTVLLDDGEEGGDGPTVAERAAVRLNDLGYSQVSILDGGVLAWRGAGHELFKGVNLPSKTFGEQVEQVFEVPHMSAPELARRLDAGEPLLLLDGRTIEEHRKMTIPSALPVPNGELALRWRSLAVDADTPIVVHCAGRTRSIVGAQILRDLGVPNPVWALENGTQGWALAGLTLERGSARTLPAAPDARAVDAARADAAALARRGGVPVLSPAQAQAWLDDAARTTVVFDVRTAAEHSARTLPGARHAPAGQLLQAIDLQLGVRHARVLLLDDEAVRAPVAALWLRRLGWEAAVVEGGIDSGLRLPVALPLPLAPALTRRSTDSLVALASATSPPLIVDLRPSLAYRRGHVEGASWSTRSRVVAHVRAASAGDRRRPVLLVAADEAIASRAAQDLREAGWRSLSWTTDDALAAAAWPRVDTPDSPTDAEAIDFLFFVHDRHDGNLDAARRYLEWETGLVAQCTPAELATFRLP